MIFGSVSIDGHAVNTHRDSYLLPSLTVVSVRRPFLVGAVIFALGFGAFGLSFGDLLYESEIKILFGGCAGALLLGLSIGQLKLLSRDLRGSELAGMIWGTYGHLNRVRRKIIRAVQCVSAAPESKA